MQQAVEAFENDFARWDLHLPAEAIESRRAGQIRHAGWSIRYNFGRDGRGAYLDYYASPRDVREDPPGDDWHVRLYDSGERAVLPPVLEAYMYGRDPTWEELERARRQYASTSDGPQTDVSATPDSHIRPDDAELVEIASSEPEADGAAQRLEAAPLPDVVETPPSAIIEAGVTESPRSEAPSEAAAPYLPLDIGLHVELDLAQGGSVSEGSTAGSPLSPASPPPRAPADLFLAPEDLTQFLPVPAEPVEAKHEEKQEVEEPEEVGEAVEGERTPASPFLLTTADEAPAPITLDASVVETVPQPGDIVSEEDELQPETLSEAEADSVESIGAVPLAEPDTLSHIPVEDFASERTGDASGGEALNDGGATDAQASPLLAGKAIPTKIFRRADLVRTADVGSIDLHVDPRTFQPWWFRPNARRAAIAIAAVLLIAVVAMARAHHRAKVAAQTLGSDIDSSAMSAPPASAASLPTTDSSGTSDTTARPDSQPTPNVDSTTSVSGTGQNQPTEPAPDLRPPAPDPGDHNADAGMAKPAGPQSLSPIVPAGKSATGATSKYPSGTFPRGYNP
jgi:hypothetical protein